MHAYFTDDQRAIKDVADRFSREVLLPRYQAREETESGFDRGLLREMGSLGLMAPDAPEEFGGPGLDCVTAGIVCESVGYGDFNIGYVPTTASLLAQIIAVYGRRHIAEEWVGKIVTGEVIMAIALTEPRGGSDAANLILRADRVEGGYVLNGEKTSISSADQADAIVLFARSGTKEQGARGVSAFLVPTNLKGITRTRFRDLGSKIVGRGSLFFDNVFLPEEFRLGEPERGFVQVMQGFDYSRALLGLQCVGSAQASLDETWRYVKQREAFNKPLAEFQGVTFPIAEGETMLAAIRALCYQTLKLRDDKLPHTAEAAMCKWIAPKTAVDVIHQCLLTHGHYGWSLDLPHQQRLRDVMGIEIGDGTAQIMKMIIARERCKSA